MNHWSEYRKSIRKYRETLLGDVFFQELTEYIDTLVPLFPDEPCGITQFPYAQDFGALIKGGLVAKLGMVQGPHYLLLQSSHSERGKCNLGYLGEAVVKFLTQKGCGTCWLGGPSFRAEILPSPDKYAIALVFGLPVSGDLELVESRSRKEVEVLCPDYKELSVPVQQVIQSLVSAPSAMNCQPWRLHLRSSESGTYKFSYDSLAPKFIKGKLLEPIIQVDMGIGLFHIVDKARDLGINTSFQSTLTGLQTGVITLG